MSANSTDKLRKLSRRWVSQIGSGGVADAVATTIPLSSTTNLPTDTAVTLVIDRVDANGTATPTSEETIVGVVSSTNIINAVRGVEGTAQAHSAGAVVEVLVTADGYNDIIDHLLVEHGQDGKHTKVNGNTVTAGTDTVALLTASQTLTNKTLTSPKINEDVALTATATQLNAQVLAGNDGWTSANETWAYASASTITVPSGAAAKYAIGDRIRWKQGAGYKYGVLVAVADTVLTIAVNTDYTVANDTITDNYYSHQASPIGYPQWFTVAAPTFDLTTVDNSSGGQPTNLQSRLNITGRICNFQFNFLGNKVTTNNIITVASPITPVNGANGSIRIASGTGFVRASGGVYTSGTVFNDNGINFSLINSSSLADNLGLDNFCLNLVFEI